MPLTIHWATPALTDVSADNGYYNDSQAKPDHPHETTDGDRAAAKSRRRRNRYSGQWPATVSMRGR